MQIQQSSCSSLIWEQQETDIQFSSEVTAMVQEKKVKKSSLLKKKKKSEFPLYNSPVVKQLFMIGDLILMNEDSVRDPQNSQQSIISNSLQFNKITSVTVNKQFLTINLKRNQENYLTVDYMLNRYRSFNDKYMKQLADNVGYLIDQINLLKEMTLKTQQQLGFQYLTLQYNKISEKRKIKYEELLKHYYHDRKYVAFYHADGLRGRVLEKISISIQMLKQTGFRVSDLVNQFAREKQLSIQLMGTGVYKDVFVNCSKQIADGMKQKRLSNKGILDPSRFQDQKVNLTKLCVPAQIYQRRHNGQVTWEQKVKCLMQICTPTTFVTVFQFGNIEVKPIAIINERTKKLSYIEWEAMANIQEQMTKLDCQDRQTLEITSDVKIDEQYLKQNPFNRCNQQTLQKSKNVQQ